MSTSPLTFTGVSTFSNDFQTILTRAGQIAQIPITQLQNKDSDALQRKTLLSSLSSAVGGLATSLSSLGDTAAHLGLAASSSNPTAVSVSNSGATASASYTINSITSTATAATERTTAHFADSTSTPVSANGSLRLVVGTKNYDFTLTNNSLIGLRDQINSENAGVTASILTTSDGNYLSISANSTGATTLKLIDDPTPGANTNLLTATNQGTNAVFSLNGIPISQAGNVVNGVIPGLTFTIQQASTTPVTLSLASDRTQLSSALQSFVTNYNATRQQLNAQVGPAAGLLSGDPIVQQLQTQLRSLASYTTSSGSVKNLADLGVEFSNTGEASFDSAAFASLSDSAVTDGFKFIGSATTGLGGFSAQLTAYSDPITGIIKSAQDGLDRIDKGLQSQITTLTDRFTLLQQSLTARLQQADALIATLQSQQTELTSSLQGLNLVLYGKNPNQAV